MLYAAYKARGADGLVSRKRGAPSSRRLQPELREVTHEKLTEVHGMTVSLTTLRKWMLSEGRQRSRSKPRPQLFLPLSTTRDRE